MPTFLTTGTTICLLLWKCCVCVGEGQAEGRVPGCSATQAAPFRGENEQCCSASPQDFSTPRGENTEEMLEGGRWGKQHIVSHTSMQMPSLRWDRNFCPCTDKNKLNYLQCFPHCSTTYKGFDLILFYKLKTPWPQLPDLDKTCINVLQTADYDPLISGTYASVQSDRGWITSSE